MAMISIGATPASWNTRSALETCITYQCAYDSFTTTQHVAASYITMVGIQGDEGVVITRDRNSPAHIEKLD